MSMSRPWLANYPAGIPAEIDADEFSSINAVLDESLRRYPERPSFSNLGRTITYADLDRLSRQPELADFLTLPAYDRID